MKSIIKKHWHGQYSLVISYWVVTVLFTNVAGLILLGISMYLMEKTTSSTLIIFIICLNLILGIIATIWATVGTWRSAERYIIEHPSRNAFGYLAMVAIILGCLKAAAELAIELSKFIQ